MNIVQPGYEIIPNVDPIKKIEKIARICYKSESAITEDSAIKMVKNLVTRQHLAMIEHADMAFEFSQEWFDLIQCFCINNESYIRKENDVKKQNFLRFTEYKENDVNHLGKPKYIISGNLRAWFNFFYIDNDSKNYLSSVIRRTIGKIINEYTENVFDFCNIFGGINEEINEDNVRMLTDSQISSLTYPERMVHQTLSVKFTVDRGISHELVRHRLCSFAQESTRYCNYSNGKFDNQITVIEPFFFKECQKEKPWLYNTWKKSCEKSEEEYLYMLNEGATPQEARTVLPNSLKTEIVVTANLGEWRHIFNLRAVGITGAPHPQMKQVMLPLLVKTKELIPNIFNDIEV